MTKRDLKPGYVIKTRCGELGIIVPCTGAGCDYGLAVVYGNKDYRTGSDPLGMWYDALTYWKDGMPSKTDIMEVYSISKSTSSLGEVSTIDRDLLWKRPAAKKMTVQEICEALGYDVEIVKDGEQ